MSSRKMLKLSNKLFNLFRNYINEYRKIDRSVDYFGFVYIRNKLTGEICCFARDTKTMQENVKFLNDIE